MTPEQIKMFELMRDVSIARDAQLRREFNRSLPFGDAIGDRWNRARRLGFDEGASIYDSACVYGEVRVGKNTWIGPYVILDGSGGGITIGSTCSIAAGVHIYTHDTVHWALSGGLLRFRQGSVRIGDCCYLGSQSVIAAGVTIGSRCVIGANSFVNDDIEDNTIVGGSTARPIGRVLGDGVNIRLELFADGQGR